MTTAGLKRIAQAALAVAALGGAPCAARDAAPGGQGDADLSLAQSFGEAPPVAASRSAAFDLGPGRLRFAVGETKAGRKRPAFGEPGSAWSRRYQADVRFVQPLSHRFAAWIGGGASYAKSGTSGGPQLTRHSKALSREVALGVVARGGEQFTLRAFDQGGWSAGDPGDLINRLANGEGPRKRGVAAELGLLGGAAGRPGVASYLALRAERSSLASGPSGNALSLVASVRF